MIFIMVRKKTERKIGLTPDNVIEKAVAASYN